jgi:hypothetical protein
MFHEALAATVDMAVLPESAAGYPESRSTIPFWIPDLVRYDDCRQLRDFSPAYYCLVREKRNE